MDIEVDLADILMARSALVVPNSGTRPTRRAHDHRFVKVVWHVCGRVRNSSIPSERYQCILVDAYLASLPIVSDEDAAATASAFADGAERKQFDLIRNMLKEFRRQIAAFDKTAVVEDVDAELEGWYGGP